MKSRAIISLFALLGCALSCLAQTTSPTAALPFQSGGSRLGWWPSPEMPVYGHAGDGIICVYVLGSVQRPGAYYLRTGVTVGDAIKAAGGAKMVDWPHHCALLRQMPLSIPRIIPFTKREDDEQIPLRDGDHLYFGHETY